MQERARCLTHYDSVTRPSGATESASCLHFSLRVTSIVQARRHQSLVGQVEFSRRSCYSGRALWTRITSARGVIAGNAMACQYLRRYARLSSQDREKQMFASEVLSTELTCFERCVAHLRQPPLNIVYTQMPRIVCSAPTTKTVRSCRPLQESRPNPTTRSAETTLSKRNPNT